MEVMHATLIDEKESPMADYMCVHSSQSNTAVIQVHKRNVLFIL